MSCAPPPCQIPTVQNQVFSLEQVARSSRMNGNSSVSSLSNTQISRASTGAISQQSTLLGNGGSDALRSAIVKFKARLTGTELTDFKNTTYDSLCQEIMRIQYDQEQSKTMANLGRLQSFLEAMHQFSKTIEVFLNVNEVVCFVWGPIKFLLLVCLHKLLKPDPPLMHFRRPAPMRSPSRLY